MKYKGLLLSVAIITICFLALIVPKSASAMPDFEDATVTTEGLEVMIRPTKISAVVTTLEHGARIGVFCEEVPGWYRIIYGNYRGYVKAKDIFLPSKDIISGNALFDGMYVRANPAGGGLALGKLNAGYPLKITNILGEWYKIEADSVDGEYVEGYVKKDNVMQTASENTEIVLTVGMQGAEVVKMQKALYDRGFYGYSASGEFESGTKASLKKFQKHAELVQTGIADQATLDKLYSSADIHSYAQDKGVSGSVMVARWWETVQFKFEKGAIATITDVRSGKQFQVQRYSGNSHADVEPLTKADTDIFRQCYGGSWSWDRRPVWVTVGSTTFAGSMNGYPHASHETRISDNGFNGHFCIHFKDSYGHGSRSEDPKHQECISSAYYASIY